MKTISKSGAVRTVRELLKRVRNGTALLILDGGRPIAWLRPVMRTGRDDSDRRLDVLERAGVIRRSAESASRVILDKRPPALRRGASALAALLAERGVDPRRRDW